MGAFANLKNQRFGRLVVIEKCGKAKNGNIKWLCKCDCGKTKIIQGSYLVLGRTTSCGCYQKEKARAMNTTHGMCETRLYKVFQRQLVAKGQIQ